MYTGNNNNNVYVLTLLQKEFLKTVLKNRAAKMKGIGNKLVRALSDDEIAKGKGPMDHLIPWMADVLFDKNLMPFIFTGEFKTTMTNPDTNVQSPFTIPKTVQERKFVDDVLGTIRIVSFIIIIR